MKLFIIIALMTCIAFTACEKSASNSITGMWKVVSDSSIVSGGEISYSVYHGASDDYFVFNGKGILYTKEANVYDTISCQQKTDSTTTFNKIGATINIVPSTATYKTTAGKMRLVVISDFINPGFTFERIINLER